MRRAERFWNQDWFIFALVGTLVVGVLVVIIWAAANSKSACGATQGIFLPDRGGSGGSGYSGGGSRSGTSRSYGSGSGSSGSRYPSRSTGGTTYYVSKYPASYPRRYTSGHLYVYQNNVWVLDDGELNGGC